MEALSSVLFLWDSGGVFREKAKSKVEKHMGLVRKFLKCIFHFLVSVALSKSRRIAALPHIPCFSDF